MASTKCPKANDKCSHLLKWFFFHTFDNRAFFAPKKRIQNRREKCEPFQIGKNYIDEISRGNWLISARFKVILFSPLGNKAFFAPKKKIKKMRE